MLFSFTYDISIIFLSPTERVKQLESAFKTISSINMVDNPLNLLANYCGYIKVEFVSSMPSVKLTLETNLFLSRISPLSSQLTSFGRTVNFHRIQDTSKERPSRCLQHQRLRRSYLEM